MKNSSIYIFATFICSQILSAHAFAEPHFALKEIISNEQIPELPASIRALSLSNDGKTLLTLGSERSTGFTVLNLETKKANVSKSPFSGLPEITRILFSADASRLGILTEHRGLFTFNIDPLSSAVSLEVMTFPAEYPFSDFTFTPTGKIVAALGQYVSSYDFQDNRWTRLIAGDRDSLNRFFPEDKNWYPSIAGIAFDEKAQTIVTAHERHIATRELKDGGVTKLFPIGNNTARFEPVSMSADGHYVVVEFCRRPDVDGKRQSDETCLFDTQKGEVVFYITPPVPAAGYNFFEAVVSKNGNIVLVHWKNLQNRNIDIYQGFDVPTGRAIAFDPVAADYRFEDRHYSNINLGLSADGKKVAIKIMNTNGGWKEKIAIWDLKD